MIRKNACTFQLDCCVSNSNSCSIIYITIIHVVTRQYRQYTIMQHQCSLPCIYFPLVKCSKNHFFRLSQRLSLYQQHTTCSYKPLYNQRSGYLQEHAAYNEKEREHDYCLRYKLVYNYDVHT